MDPVTTASALSGLLGVLKTISGIAKDVNNVELNRQISEIQMKVFEVQERLLALQEENRHLREENQRLKDVAQLRERVVFHDHANWERLDNGSEEGPFCPSCWAKGELRRPQIMYVEDGQVQLACAEHKTPYSFRVPERLVKGDLSPYKNSAVSDGDPIEW